MTKLNHVPHRTLHTLISDVEEFKVYYELSKTRKLLQSKSDARFNLSWNLEKLIYLEALEIVYQKVLQKEIDLTSFLRFLASRSYNKLSFSEADYYYKNLLECFGSDLIYSKLPKIRRQISQSCIEYNFILIPFNSNKLSFSVWWDQYYENRPNQKPTINRKLRPYAITHNWGWYITPREKRKGLYKKRYRQKLKTELNKELDEYFTNTY